MSKTRSRRGRAADAARRRTEDTAQTIPDARSGPEDDRGLRAYVHGRQSLTLATSPVCRHHRPPGLAFLELFVNRPPLALVLGPRGGGKSYLSALDTHLRSRFTPGHATRILGGSRAQSAQVYQALRELASSGPDAEAVSKLMKEGARYVNGSEVSILSASSTSVRGPHVPSLKLDEVDEIPDDIREAAMGMCMNRGGSNASILMTSTWHRVDGPMSALMQRAEAGEFPQYTYCAFEVLERCPEERSGPGLERCPECPLMAWCHEDRDDDPQGRPKAKRAGGHYGIDALIQKVRATSLRTFESDYLCKGPRADGLWFTGFDESAAVTERAEYDPALPVHLAIDPGVFTGAVAFQVAKVPVPEGIVEEVHVFADYLAENTSAEQNGRNLTAMMAERCNGRVDASWFDPSGSTRNPVGPTVLAELERGGLRGLRGWPRGSVADGLALVESFVQPADGRTRLLIHPRCTALARALRSYRRAKRTGQWQDYPEDPQHPAEDLVDALRGGLRGVFPEGRRPKAPTVRMPARRVF